MFFRFCVTSCEKQSRRLHIDPATIYLSAAHSLLLGDHREFESRLRGDVSVSGRERKHEGVRLETLTLDRGRGGRGSGAATNALRADPNTQLVALADVFPVQTQISAKLLKERTAITNRLESFSALDNDLGDNELLLEMAEEEDDAATIEEVTAQIQDLESRIDKLHVSLMLSGPDDHSNAILSINAGAGGTEAQLRVLESIIAGT